MAAINEARRRASQQNIRKAQERMPQIECDLAPLREAFLRSGLSAADVARALGWTCQAHGRPHADGPRVKRALGLKPQQNGDGLVTTRQRCSYEMAVRLAAAIGVDPWEVGL